MYGGIGRDFRTRTERDAKLFLKEQELRAGQRPPRRQQRIALLLLAIVVLGWTLWSLLGPIP